MKRLDFKKDRRWMMERYEKGHAAGKLILPPGGLIIMVL